MVQEADRTGSPVYDYVPALQAAAEQIADKLETALESEVQN